MEHKLGQTDQLSGFRYLSWIMVIYITFQLVSDVTAGKIINFFGNPVSVTVLYFPITYLFSDVLTEVYGYGPARGVLWRVLAASMLAGVTYQIAAYWPPAEGFLKDQSYRDVFSVVPRILIGGWIAVFCGDIVNNFIMAKVKVWSDGKWLWLRAVLSTIGGQAVNTSVFYIVALYGVLPKNMLIEAVLTGWIIKSCVEFVCLPATYAICGFLKKAEGIDTFDRNTNFNPFIIDSFGK